MDEKIVSLECCKHDKFFDNDTLYSHLQKCEGVVLSEKEDITDKVKCAKNQKVFKYFYRNPKETTNTFVVERYWGYGRGFNKFDSEAFHIKKISDKEDFNAASIKEFLLQFDNKDDGDDPCRTIGRRKRPPMNSENTEDNQAGTQR